MYPDTYKAIQAGIYGVAFLFIFLFLIVLIRLHKHLKHINRPLENFTNIGTAPQQFIIQRQPPPGYSSQIEVQPEYNPYIIAQR